MPRQKGVDEARVIYHAINRGNARNSIFHKSEDYDAFLRVLAEGLVKDKKGTGVVCVEKKLTLLFL